MMLPPSLSTLASPTGVRARRSGARADAFTLVEMLTVIALIAILLALTMPAFKQISGGLEMSTTSQNLIAQLTQARQTAIARNRDVELRIYSYEGSLGNEKHYQAYQSFLAKDDSSSAWEPLGTIQKLPVQIVFDSGSTLSPLIGDQTAKPGSASGVKISGAGLDYDYVTVTFRPDGSALPDAAGARGVFLTIKEARLPDPGTALPDNYAIVQIFPSTGLIRSYRP